MTKLSKLLVGLILIYFFTSCKKDINVTDKLSHAPVPIEAGKLAKLKSWLIEQKHSLSRVEEDDPETQLPDVEPEWQDGQYYPIDHVYRFPLQFEDNTPFVSQYLIFHEDEIGTIITGEYIFINLEEDDPTNITPEQLKTLNPKVFDLENFPDNLSASILKYTANGDLIEALQVDGSTVSESHEQIEFERALEAGCNGQNLCTAWYWVVMDDEGNIVSYQYLTTTCECQQSGGGNGGTGTTLGGETFKYKAWYVRDNMYYKILSSEKIFGIRNVGSSGGHFTNMEHLNDELVTHSLNTFQWTDNSYNILVLSQTAKSTVFGKLTDPSNPYWTTVYVTTDNSKQWTFGQVFP